MSVPDLDILNFLEERGMDPIGAGDVFRAVYQYAKARPDLSTPDDVWNAYQAGEPPAFD